jgi:GNAT superfamily N-acetyltransferase
MDAILTLTDAPSAEQQRVIGSGLAKFNAEQAGYSDSRDLAVLVFVDLFYVPDALRGQRLGSRVLAAAEDEARRRGCSAAARSERSPVSLRVPVASS